MYDNYGYPDRWIIIQCEKEMSYQAIKEVSRNFIFPTVWHSGKGKVRYNKKDWWLSSFWCYLGKWLISRQDREIILYETIMLETWHYV